MRKAETPRFWHSGRFGSLENLKIFMNSVIQYGKKAERQVFQMQKENMAHAGAGLGRAISSPGFATPSAASARTDGVSNLIQS